MLSVVFGAFVDCVFGVGWELAVGGLRGAAPLVDLIIIPYVALSYPYVSMLPLEILVGNWTPRPFHEVRRQILS